MVTDMSLMFHQAPLSTANYDALLLGWSALNLQNDVTFWADNSTYSSSAQSARNILTDVYNWTVYDAGVTP